MRDLGTSGVLLEVTQALTSDLIVTLAGDDSVPADAVVFD